MRPAKTFFGKALIVTGALLILFSQGDPSQAAPSLDFATYLGGGETIPGYPESIGSPDFGYAVALDGEGNVYVAGEIYSNDFPWTNYFMSDEFIDPSGFVAKFSPTGEYLFSALFDDSQIFDLALDDTGNIYITGATWSENLPLVNEYQGHIADSTFPEFNAFLMKLAPDLSVLYSTYIGGTKPDKGYGVDADDAGYAYVTGGTFSSDFTNKGEFMADPDGADREDIWVAKFNTNQAGDDSLVYSTYLDGIGDGRGYKIAADNIGNTYVVGTTKASDFPLQNEYMGDPGGCLRIVVAKLSPDGDDLLYSTYIGRTYTFDISNRCDIDATDDGQVYVTGTTPWFSFPIRNAYQDVPLGDDAFLTRLNTNLAGDASLVYSTFFGGTLIDEGLSIAADSTGKVYLTGRTNSPDFPLREFRPPSVSGNFDIFLAQFDTTLTGEDSLLWSTYSGGTAEDGGRAVAIDEATGGLAIVGVTLSDDLTVSPGAFQSTHANVDFYDAFVMKFSESADIAMPIPQDPSRKYYRAPSFPVLRPRPDECLPLGAVQVTRSILYAQLSLPKFQASADLYLALYGSEEAISGFSNNNQELPLEGDTYFINSKGGLQQSMTPWMAGVTDPVSQLLAVDIHDLQFDEPYLNLAVVALPLSNQVDQVVAEMQQFNNYYAWITQIPVPRNQLEETIQSLETLLTANQVTKDKALQQAIACLQNSLNAKYWLDPWTLDDEGQKALQANKQAVQKLIATKSQQSEITQAIETILDADYTLATFAIVDAVATGGKPHQIEQARESLIKASTEQANKDFDSAANYYKVVVTQAGNPK